MVPFAPRLTYCSNVHAAPDLAVTPLLNLFSILDGLSNLLLQNTTLRHLFSCMQSKTDHMCCLDVILLEQPASDDQLLDLVCTLADDH